MRRDELIEELKKCPYDSEVRVELLLTPDFMDECFRSRGGCYKEAMPIERIRSIPDIVIEVRQ